MPEEIEAPTLEEAFDAAQQLVADNGGEPISWEWNAPGQSAEELEENRRLSAEALAWLRSEEPGPR